MKKLFGYISALLLAANTASANPIFEEYIDWIVANSEFEYNGEPLPTIERTNKAMLLIMLYGEQRVAQAEYNNTYLPEVEAIYDDETNTIFLPHETELEDFANHHIIVHELVHYLQDINGITDECVGRLEAPAYKLHTQWQDEVDHPAERPNGLFVMMLELACDNPHF